MIHVRRAGSMDCRAMSDLLNEVIAIGGTTAMTDSTDAATIAGIMGKGPLSLWHVAEDEEGTLMGFQWVEPHPDHEDPVGQIATFARVGQTGLGIGSKLFAATRDAAQAAGYIWINAEIRADNAGGLTYYQSRGFEDYGRIRGYRLGDGTTVDKILKRYDL